MNRDERIVVVGGGLTGLRAAERLRELKFEGDITILGDEKLPPYHRPALSKQLLQGSLRPSDLTLPAYEDLNARWRFGTQVRQLIPNKKTLVLPGGEEMTYDGLIIATGVEATRQNGVPYHDPRVLVLRTMSDGLDLERVIGSTKGRVAVVGGGFTGCELAASLRHLSREVTLIGRGKNLLGNVLGPDLGEWLTNMHRDHGVDLALGNSIEEWAPGSESIALKLTDGSRVEVSCVILAAGTKPMTHWLRGSGLPLDNGVVCEPTCHVVGADDVVAAGDVAQWPNLRFDNVPRRVEHWLNAVEMGRAAAESLLAGRANAVPFTPMPRFWTDQYSARIQAAGMLKLGKDIVKLGTPDEGTGTVYGFSSEGRLMGVVGVDCPGAMIAWAESVSRQNPEPRTRVPEEQQAAEAAKAPITVGGLSKKQKGKHLAPPREKQFQSSGETPGQEIGFVEHPAEVSGPVAVGAATVAGGRAKNVVDSFSRMLPVAVRPQDSPPPPPSARLGLPPGTRTMPSGPFPVQSSGPLRRAALSGPMGTPPFGDASASGTFPPAAASGQFPAAASAQFPPAGVSGRFPPAQLSGQFPAAAASGQFPPAQVSGEFPPVAPSGQFPPAQVSGEFPPVAPSGQFPTGTQAPANGFAGGAGPNRNGSTGSFPATGRPGGSRGGMRVNSAPVTGFSIRNGAGRNGSTAQNNRTRNGVPSPPFGTPVPGRQGAGQFGTPEVAPPEFSAAEMTDIRALPEPLVGRLGPNSGLAIDVTGQMALLDANGHVRTPEFSDVPPRGPVDSVNAMPPVRGPESSFTGLPPARRSEQSSHLPAVRGPQDSHRALPPARRNPSESVSGMPPVRRGAQDSFAALPPARRGGPEDSSAGMPPARRGVQDSSAAMPPVRRGAQDSISAMPPARRGAQDSFSAMPPARRGGPEDSFDAMPPVRRGAQDSFSALPPARRNPSESVSGMPPVRRGAQDSFAALPPARRGGPEDSSAAMPPARRGAQDSFSALPPARRGGAVDLTSEMPATRGDAQESYGALPPVVPPSAPGGRRRADEDAYNTIVQGGGSHHRAAAHRAEDLTPEFGMPPKRRRTPDPDKSSIRMVPAMSSVDDSIEMPPVRMPKHGRPEDYGVPSARGGPEDSYDHMPAVERPRSTGGRRRARA
jgi:NADPH-dependent 2,4-dienoyl-CoA reductase/sulfur reductase-like enzyme